MTFAHTSIGRTMSRTRTLLKKQLWIWPIAAVVLLSVIGYVVSSSIERTMQENLRSELQTLLTVERSMLLKWFKEQESSASSLANDGRTRKTIAELLAATDQEREPEAPAAKATAKDLRVQLAKELEAGMSSHDFVAYLLVDKRQRIVAAQTDALIGQIVPQYESFLARTLDGKATVSAPFESVTALKDRSGRMQTGVPTMFVCAPVRDENFQVVAALAMRIRPEKEFTDILQLGRLGQTGETYAVNKQGLMVSNSRFDSALMLLGLLPDDDHAASILNVQVRDPGGNMVEGFRPGVRRRELPLTQICAAAVSGTSGVTMDSYRDYRGSPSVGAWTWLPDYQIGMITEVDTAEAFHPLTILKRSFYAMYALLGVSAPSRSSCLR